ncbi:TIR domain-containing protein [Butyrivibrio sp. FCS014]|uniref:TIR domain-containing protein n=1 Tax=Butyrivibrio sp. FCS014 TaxID=1408304 RepID=UPI000466F62E|nr:TIR domain-containing protein [Butyrivibrio sp. FCS014]
MKYDAFVSYRHLERDKFVAKGIHRALETSRIPRKIQKETGKKRINRVFRDQEELQVGSELGSNIEQALSESEHLVVICTPETKDSYWVMKEIDTFIAMHGRENILAVLADGEPSEAFPPQLLVDDEGNPVEPLAADVRGDSKREISKKIKSESLRLVAAILGCDYDDLKQRRKERIVRRSMAIVAGVAALSTAFAVYNAYNLHRITENYQKMQIKESKVLAEKSIDALEAGDRQTAGLLAMEGLPVNGKDRPLVSDCIYALEKATDSYDSGEELVYDKILRHDLPLSDFRVNDDESRLVSFDVDNGVYWWDLSSGKRILKRNPEVIEDSKNSVYAVGENNGHMVVVSGRYLTAFDEEGNVVYDVNFEDKECDDAYIDDMSKYAVVVRGAYDDDGQLEIYDLSDGSFVGKYPQKKEKSFNVDCAHFNSDYSLLLVHQWEVLGHNPAILNLIDIKAGKMTEFDVKEKYVNDCAFTVDNNLVVASSKIDSIKLYVQKFDMNTGEEIFCKELEYGVSYSKYGAHSGVHIGSRTYQYLNEEGQELVVAASDKLFNLDLDTGEIKLKYTAPFCIAKITLLDDIDRMLVGTIDGRLVKIHSTTGNSSTTDPYFLTEGLKDYYYGKEHLIASDSYTPNMVVMSFLPDPDREEYGRCEYNIEQIAASPSGRTFFVKTFKTNTDEKSYIHVYDTESGQEITNISYDNIAYSQDAFYKDEDTIVIFRDGDVSAYQYTISIGQTEEITFLDEFDWTSSVIGEDGRYLLDYIYHDYYVVDLASNSVIYHYVDEGYEHDFSQCSLVDDGKRAIGMDYHGAAFGLDLENGEWTEYNIDYFVRNIGASQDGKYIAAYCIDGKMRIIDTGKNSVVQEFDYFGDEHYSLIKFSADDKLLFLQGQDKLFKVYDLDKGGYIFISDVQMKAITYVDHDIASNTVTISDNNGMYIIDLNDRGFLHYIPRGEIFIPARSEAICSYDTGVFKYKVRSVDELVDFFYERFDGAELTDEQKVRYRIY